MSIAEDLEQELDLFRQFVMEKVKTEPHTKLKLEEALIKFREYQFELDRLRDELRPAYEASLRGEGKPLDFQMLRSELVNELKSKGYT